MEREQEEKHELSLEQKNKLMTQVGFLRFLVEEKGQPDLDQLFAAKQIETLNSEATDEAQKIISEHQLIKQRQAADQKEADRLIQNIESNQATTKTLVSTNDTSNQRELQKQRFETHLGELRKTQIYMDNNRLYQEIQTLRWHLARKIKEDLKTGGFKEKDSEYEYIILVIEKGKLKLGLDQNRNITAQFIRTGEDQNGTYKILSTFSIQSSGCCSSPEIKGAHTVLDHLERVVIQQNEELNLESLENENGYDILKDISNIFTAYLEGKGKVVKSKGILARLKNKFHLK